MRLLEPTHERCVQNPQIPATYAGASPVVNAPPQLAPSGTSAGFPGMGGKLTGWFSGCKWSVGVDGGTLIPADERISLTVRFWWGVLLVLMPVRLLVLLAACRLLRTLLPGLLLLLLLLFFSFDRCSSSQFSCDGNRCCAPACVPAVSVYEVVQICCWAFYLSRRRQPRPPRATPSPYPSVSSLSLAASPCVGNAGRCGVAGLNPAIPTMSALPTRTRGNGWSMTRARTRTAVRERN